MVVNSQQSESTVGVVVGVKFVIRKIRQLIFAYLSLRNRIFLYLSERRQKLLNRFALK